MSTILLILSTVWLTCCAYEVHIVKHVKPGVSVFNASLATGKWIYSLRHATKDILSVDTFSGILYVSNTPDCRHMLSNPTHMYIMATKYDPSNCQHVVEIPVDVFVHGENCIIKYRRKSRLKTWDTHLNSLVPDDYSLISTQLDSNFGLCIEKNTPVLSLMSFIPESLHKCSLHFSINKNTLFQIDSSSGSLQTSESFCFVLPYHSLKGVYNVSGNCNHTKLHSDSEMPFELVLHVNSGLRDRLTEKLTMTIGETTLNMNKIKTHIHSRRKRDANQPPTFSQRLYIKSVPEEQNPNYIIATITATDPDGETGSLRYSLKASMDGRSQSMFKIDEISGQLSTRQKLDRESIGDHYFNVYAVDAGSPQQTASAQLTIYVEDINDHAPKFENDLYTRSVSESTSIGTTVLTVRAVDLDDGDNAQLEYTILNPSGPNEVFRIENSAGGGMIITRASLDREVNEFYTLKIQATDKARVTERKSSTAMVEITVLDENDNKPQFKKNSYTIDVLEDIDPTEHPVIAEIRATDNDTGVNSQIRYTITGGNNDGTFSIDQFTGRLSVVKPLDYEKTPSGFNLNVRAQDGGSPAKASSTNVLIRVIDVNDNPPRFYTTVYHETVPEDVPIGYTIIRVTAFDTDSGDNGRLNYTITKAPSDMPIEININSGDIITKASLDRETDAHYSFVVVVSDYGKPKRSSTAKVDITVLDVNDNSPVFAKHVYNELISEEDPPGTPVVEVLATDADEKKRVEYTITSGNTDNTFQIIFQMGAGLIATAKHLDYKKINRFELTITARDGGGLTDTAIVKINVSDANTFRPKFQDEPYYVSKPEDLPVGSTIFTVHATDEDVGANGKISYTMQESDVFSINPQSGAIILKAALDREKIGAYTLSVTATDHGRPVKSDTTDIEIIVQDVNDNSPVFAVQEYKGEIEENAKVGTSILQISATDEDQAMNRRIRYTFEGGDNGDGHFVLDQTSGILRTASKLDREKVAYYNLIAFAVDKGSTEKSTSVPIGIKIIDYNDNAPQFETNPIHMYIRENSPIGSEVGTVSASDPDEGDNAKIEYIIEGGPDKNSFALSTQKGGPATITTLIELDYEGVKKEYTLMLQARSNPLISDAKIIIHVQDINDNGPIMKDFTIIVNNYVGHFPSGIIGNIPAVDPDESDRLRYRIISGNQANSLHLDEDKGVLQLDTRLNSDVPYNGTMQVSVTDGINEVEATARLFVRLVTQEMLYHSITVRLNNIDTVAFLSPLYNLFVSALASIIPTSFDNIFIVNIQDDTDVIEKVLNVSFSVRKNVVNNKDVFYSQEFLKERVYLQRVLLAQISTLEVLPFDDNLCITEPCLNFEHCVSILRFDKAAAFVWSDTMLFRPIHPYSYFDCICPDGFAGMEQEKMCDIEVNLCYSNPCANNGTCIQKEGGYTCHCAPHYAGKLCEINMETKRYETCPRGVCKGSSYCTPLIRGGFRCEVCPLGAGQGVSRERCVDCAEIEDRTKYCDLRTRSFTSGSFLMYPSLKRRHRFTIKMTFSTRQNNALLFYNGRFNEKHDFIALEIIDGLMQFSFSLGSNVTKVKAKLIGGGSVNDGNWHVVTVKYLNRTAILSVGEDCDTQLSLDYGPQQIKDYRCAAKGTQELETLCDNPTQLCHRLLDLTGPFQIGGVPRLPIDFQISNREFVGCIQDVYVDNEFLDLNSFVWNNGTQEGCVQKGTTCKTAPCKNGGTCVEGWSTYQCQCADSWGSKDCSQAIDLPYKLTTSTAYLLLDQAKPSVTLPWYNGLAFRTRSDNGFLMQIEVGNIYVKIKLINGLIHYIHPEKTAVLNGVKVNDGMWHYLETRWLQGLLQIILDYGQVEKAEPFGNWIIGQPVKKVYVGGLEQMPPSGGQPETGIVGCVKDIRVGNGPSAIQRNPTLIGAAEGCVVSNPCDNKPCTGQSVCVDQWMSHSCVCADGRIGQNCDEICTRFNPCKGGAQCQPNKTSKQGYQCKCKEGQSGQYCEEETQKSCPATWYGTPFCGPCKCAVKKGFNPYCKNTNGKCVCKVNHYKPEGSDTCLPCECYEVGTINNSKSCHPTTGQCKCKEEVVGRKCDLCTSKFAEVTSQGCEVRYDVCPRSYSGGMWWERAAYGSTRWQPCPKSGDFYGTVGNASRTCTLSNGWTEPDMFNCTSRLFVDLQKQTLDLNNRNVKVTTYLSKELVKDIYNATNKTVHMFGNDIYIAYQILMHVLSYENAQTGLNLTHTRDRYFIQYIVDTVGRITDQQFKNDWTVIQNKSKGAVALIRVLEEYSNTLATNLHQVYIQPFDAVHDNIVFGLDTILKENLTTVTLPKYNNKVRNPGIFDTNTQVTVPVDKILKKPRSKSSFKDEIMINNKPVAAVGYILMKNVGQILPNNYDKSISVPKGIPLTINSPIFSLTIVDRNQTLAGELPAPISLQFKQQVIENRTRPQCVFWEYTDNKKNNGEWDTKGCVLKTQQTHPAGKFITCECNHMTSFGVVMAIYDKELPATEAVSVEFITYIGFAIALICFAVGFLLFCCMRGLETNANSIHINLAFVLFVANLAYIVGINKVSPQLGCKFVAIALHYFYLSTFAWMFVEVLHLYRMIMEIRNVNHGSMKFYYLFGYVIPGIIVCLAVGLNTEGYGENGKFCWLETNSLLMWSYSAPVILVVVMNFIIFAFALKGNCTAKKEDLEKSSQKYSLYAILMIMPLMGVTWIFGLLAVNDDNAAFHYLFAVLTCFQGVFLLLGYIVFNKYTRKDLKYTLQKLQGKKDLDDSISGTRTSMLSRSALAYHHNDSSLDGGLNRLNSVGISTTSTTSRSTTENSKPGAYRGDGFLHTGSSSTSANIPTIKEVPEGVPAPYGFDPSVYGGKKSTRGSTNKGLDSDSDSELSAMEHPDLELASSHSSDEDDEVAYPPWQQKPKNMMSVPPSKPKGKTRPIAHVLPSTSSSNKSNIPPSNAPLQLPPQNTTNNTMYVPPYSKVPSTPPQQSRSHITSSPRTPNQSHRSIPPTTPPRGPNWPPPSGQQRNYSPASQFSGDAVNPDHINLKISNMRPSNDHSLRDNPYKGSNGNDLDRSGPIEQGDHITHVPKVQFQDSPIYNQQHQHRSPSSPRDKVLVLKQSGSITDENEPLIPVSDGHNNTFTETWLLNHFTEDWADFSEGM